MIVGLSGSTEMKIPIINALFREVDIRGIFRYTNWYVSMAMICYFIALFITRSVKINSVVQHL